jgi:hypothetical protein
VISDKFNNVRLHQSAPGAYINKGLGRIVEVDERQANPYHIVLEGHTTGLWYKRRDFEYIEPQISGAAAIDMIEEALNSVEPLPRIRKIVEQYRRWNG